MMLVPASRPACTYPFQTSATRDTDTQHIVLQRYYCTQARKLQVSVTHMPFSRLTAEDSGQTIDEKEARVPRVDAF